DFQCPACEAYYSILKQVHEKYGNKIQFVYRHFPLSTIHPHAERAAQVAEAAGKQGKFWEMHDMLFENQSSWSSEGNPDQTFIKYAERLTLDLDRFKKELDSKEVRGKVTNDSSSGAKLGVQGTPTFFLGGKQLDRNPQSFEEFSEIITNALASQ
ncbi:MAG: DsbA family protein, partial [bacterium]|nr:DsbA family protein [bacterium]